MGWGPGRGPRSKVQGSQHCGGGGCWPSQEVGGKAGAPAGEVGGPLEVSLVGALHPSFPLVPRPWESRSIQDTDKLCLVTRERPRPLTGVRGGQSPGLWGTFFCLIHSPFTVGLHTFISWYTQAPFQTSGWLLGKISEQGENHRDVCIYTLHAFLYLDANKYPFTR